MLIRATICILSLLLFLDVSYGFNSEYIAGVSQYSMVLPSVFSLIGSLLVITTYVIFPPLRKLRFVELLTYTSINDVLFSIGTLMGSVETGSAACYYQGLTGNFCIVSSAFWTTVITYQLYLAVHGGRILRRLLWFRVTSVVIPVTLAVLPFITNSYANVSGSYCFIDRSDGNRLRQKLWMLASFYFWIFLAVAVQIGFLIKIAHKVYRVRGSKESKNNIWSSLRKLVWYPSIFIVCWCFDAIADLSGIEQSDKRSNGDQESGDSVMTEDFVIAGVTLSMLQGFFFSLAFFVNNSIVRECWLEQLKVIYLEGLICLGYNEDDLLEVSGIRESDGQDRETLEGNTNPSLSADGISRVSTRGSARISAGAEAGAVQLTTGGVSVGSGRTPSSRTSGGGGGGMGKEGLSLLDMRRFSTMVEQEMDFILPKGTGGGRSSSARAAGLAPPPLSSAGKGAGEEETAGSGSGSGLERDAIPDETAPPKRGSSPIDVMEGGAAETVQNPVWKDTDM